MFDKIYYNPKLKKIAQKLRKQGTMAEIILWKHLKNKQIMGLDFHRQKPIDNYIVDCFCPQLMLAIEIDGSSHNEKNELDSRPGDVVVTYDANKDSPLGQRTVLESAPDVTNEGSTPRPSPSSGHHSLEGIKIGNSLDT